jgi:hypothetical protein
MTRFCYENPMIVSDVESRPEKVDFGSIEVASRQLLKEMLKHQEDLQKSFRLEWSRFTDFKVAIRLDSTAWYDRVLRPHFENDAHTKARDFVEKTMNEELDRTKSIGKTQEAHEFVNLKEYCPINGCRRSECKLYHPEISCQMPLKSRGGVFSKCGWGIHSELILQPLNATNQQFLTVARYEPLRYVLYIETFSRF